MNGRADSVTNGVGLAVPYDEIWVEDFEFNGRDGEAPTPICLVAHEVISGRTIRLWLISLDRRHLTEAMRML